MKSVPFLSLLFPTFFLPSILLAAPVEVVPPSFGAALQPQAAAARDGRVHVVFGRDEKIYHLASSDGVHFDAPRTVATLPKLALGMRRGPRIAVAEGALTVTAISHADGQLHSWRSVDGGQTWTEGPDLNTVARSASEGLHNMASDRQKLVAVVWQDARSGQMEVWSRVSRDGGLNWDAETRVYASPEGPICPCCHPSVAFGPKGEVGVMWRNSLGGFRDLWMAESRDQGRTFSPGQRLGTGQWTFNACPMDGGGLAFDSAGQPVAVWRRETNVFLSTATTPEQRLDSGAMQPVVALSDSTRWIVWQEEKTLKYRRDASPAATLSAHGRAPSLVPLPGGRALAVWENSALNEGALQAEVLP